MSGTVVVRGNAAVPAEPDQLELTLTLSSVAESANDALSEAAGLSAELVAVLNGLGVAEHARSTSGVSVREEFERVEGRWVRRGYRASNHVVIRLEESSQAGRLMTEAVGRARARIDGPRWRFKLENPARVEACRQAVVDARRKAEAYAGALGLRLGPVLRVSEVVAGEAGGPRPIAFAAEGAVGGGPTEMQVQGGRLDVEATVEVRFGLEPA